MEAPDDEEEAAAAAVVEEEEEGGVGTTSVEDTELTDTEESLSLVLWVVVLFGTAPPLSLSLFAFSFFLFAEEVGLLSVWREEDEAVSSVVFEDDGAVRLGGGLK